MSKTIIMTTDELNEFHETTVKLAVQETMKAIEKHASKESVRKREVKAIRNKLASYRAHKRSLEEDIDFTQAEKAEYRLAFLEDLMGVRTLDANYTEEVLAAREEKRRKVRYEIIILEHAMNKYHEEIQASGDRERERWYNVMHAFYVAEEPSTMEDIAEKEGISRATAWRDLDKACAVILEYIV